MKLKKTNTVITIEKVGEDLYSTKAHSKEDDGKIGDILIAALCDYMKKLADNKGIPREILANVIIKCVKKALVEGLAENKGEPHHE